MTVDDTSALQGCSVLVTRPAGQSDALCRLVTAAGGKATPLPCLSIESLEPAASLREALTDDTSYDWLIFISRNAVDQLHRLGQWPQGPIVAIGQATARHLEQLGHPVDLIPDNGFTSEDLLDDPAMQTVRDKRILIVRGEGGRTHLADTLTARGALLTQAPLYRRVLPKNDPRPLLQDWATSGRRLLTISSGEGLNNFLRLCPDDLLPLLRESIVVVPSERIAQRADELALFARVEVAANATDAETLRCLISLCTSV